MSFLVVIPANITITKDLKIIKSSINDIPNTDKQLARPLLGRLKSVKAVQKKLINIVIKMTTSTANLMSDCPLNSDAEDLEGCSYED